MFIRVARIGKVKNGEFIIQYYQSFSFCVFDIEEKFWCGIVSTWAIGMVVEMIFLDKMV